MKRVLAAGLLALGAPAMADPVEQGRAFAQANCAGCHAVGTEDASPNPRSIPFRFLGKLYPLEGLEEALAEGIYTSHEMPEFELDAAQITSLILYLDSIQVRAH